MHINLRFETVRRLFERAAFLRSRLTFLILCYTVIMSVVTIRRHYLFFSGAWDLGIFDQIFWSTLHGRFFYYSVEPWHGQNLLGSHFSPILVLLVPFYAIYPHPETLLVLQSFVIALGAVPVYHLARHELDERLAGLFPLLYLIYPPLLGANLFDFHVEAFLPVTLLSALYFLKKRRLGLYTLFLLLALMSLEYVAFLAILIALYEVATKIKAKRELKESAPYVLLAVSLSIISLVSAFVLRSYLRTPETRPMSILAPVLNEIGNPLRLLGYLVAHPYGKLFYMVSLLGPLLFTSLLSPFLLLTMPWLLLAFILNYGPYYQIGYQYSLVVIPFVFLASIYGIKRILRPKALKRQTFVRLLIVCSLLFLIWSASAIEPSRIFGNERVENTHRIISLIPQNASVLTLNNLFPHISNRFDAWILPWSGFRGTGEPFPYFYTNISKVIEHYEQKILEETNPDFVLLDLASGAEVGIIESITSELLINKSYGLYASAERTLLYKKHYESSPIVYGSLLDMKFNYKHLGLYDGSFILKDPTAESGTILVHTTDHLNNITFWTGPCLMTPPGQYNVTFRLKMSGEPQNIGVITLDIATNKGTQILNSMVVRMSDFKQQDAWQEFTLRFKIEWPTRLEFRGVRASNKVNLGLDYIHVIHLP